MNINCTIQTMPKDLTVLRATRKTHGPAAVIILFVLVILAGLLVLVISNHLVNLSQVEAAETKNFISQIWLDQYGLNLTQTADDLLLDHDNDGLSVFQEYIQMTNPFNPDTDGDGYLDGVEVKNNYNPLGSGRQDSDKDGLPNYWENTNHLSAQNAADVLSDPDEDKVNNQAEFIHLINPHHKDTDADGHLDSAEINNNYNTSGNGRPQTTITIAKINVTAPVIWSVSTEENIIQADLKHGVVRYPDKDTDGVPGGPGNLFITGHSSDYVWKDGSYKFIFSKLNQLEPGDLVTITNTQTNGRQIKYTYKIYHKEVVEADDQQLFAKTDQARLTLVTCWPLYTNQKRLMVLASLVE